MQQEHQTPALGALVKRVDEFFSWIQFFALIAICIAAVFCFGAELWKMISQEAVGLGDLLLLFLYTEVVVMARAAMKSHNELTLAMPIAIAVVALARYMVVGADHNALHLLMYAGAIFILVGSLFMWCWRKTEVIKSE